MREFEELLYRDDKEAAARYVDDLFEKGRLEEAAFCYANLMMESKKPGPALYILQQLAKDHPKSWPAWQNLGRAYEEFDMGDAAVEASLRAYELKPDEPGVILGLSCAYTWAHDWPKSIEWSRKALALNGEFEVQAMVNLGYALLATKQYGEGWDAYNRGVGHMVWREKYDFGLPDWKGEPDASVLFYKEQGIGDQMAFLSCLPEALDVVAAVTTTPKLTKLIRGSFDIPVYEDSNNAGWLSETGATHQAPVSALPQFYRRNLEDFTGAPYLKVNQDKKIQWKALLDSISDKPKIGIAWTGGSKGSAGSRRRNIPLEDFGPLFEMDAEFVSLQYKDDRAELAAFEGRHIHSWPWATQTNDYGDTAALVSCLDAVVCVPTAVYHLCGALGVPCHVMVHERPHYHETIPWWKSVTFHPRKTTTFERIKEILHESNIYRSRRASTISLHGPTIEHHPQRFSPGLDNATALTAIADHPAWID